MKRTKNNYKMFLENILFFIFKIKNRKQFLIAKLLSKIIVKRSLSHLVTFRASTFDI